MAGFDITAHLPVLWAAILGIAVVFYVVLDGFDLGIGMLLPFARNDAERDRMLASIAPFWDGNETWLVLGGGGLLVAFPRAYSIIMPAFYLPLIVMLLAWCFAALPSSSAPSRKATRCGMRSLRRVRRSRPYARASFSAAWCKV